MLKIKGYIDLLILQEYGFKVREIDNYLVKKVYVGNESDDKLFYEINPLSRIIEITRLDGDLDDTLYDLIKDDLVEKVNDKD